MNAKEKAKFIFDSMYNSMEDKHGFHIGHEISKQCALIAVEEILNSNPTRIHWTTDGHGLEETITYSDHRFWEAVKIEIQNM